MEKSLCLPEIIRVICEHLADDSTLSIALACRAFLEPGLNQRWRCIASFEPLIACLPADLWRSEQDGSLTTLFLRRSVTPEDLHRYRTFYAKRIRYFRPLCERTRALSIQALHGLQIATDWAFGALCPLVTSLVWWMPQSLPNADPTKHMFPFLSMFLGTNIDSLIVTVSPSDPLHSPFLRSALSRLKDLKKLRIMDVTNVDDTVTPSLDKPITSFTLDRLEYLSVAYISEVAIAHLAQLPCLGTLRIKNLISHFATPPASGRKSNRSPGFPSLQRVGIDAPVLTDIASFFQYLPPENQLKSVDITARICTSVSDFQSIIGTIQHQCQPTMLESLTIEIQDQSRENLDPVIHPEPDISPLFAFSHLRTLILSVDGGFSLTPDVVGRIPSAFPNIEDLKLYSSYPNSKSPRIDHTHLVALSQRCGSLESVGLLFDTTHISDQDAITSTPTGLRELDVGYSPIRSPRLVTAFLKAHFPRLWCLNWNRRRGGRDGELEVPPLVEKRWEIVSKSF